MMRCRLIQHCTLATIILSVGPIGWARASAEAPRIETSGGPYCGVYSLYTAFQVLGHKSVRFEQLVDAKYVGSYSGSSLGELRQAAIDFGLKAQALEGLTASTLRFSSYPVLLHVRRPGLNMPFAHWVLFLGVEDGQARIVDPPHGAQLMSFAELLSLWDGVGLIVAPQEAVLWPIRATAWLSQGILLLILVAVLSIARSVARRVRFSPRFGSLLLLSAVAFGVGILVNIVDDGGLLGRPAAIAQSIGQHFKPELPTLSTIEVARLVGRPETTIIDARYARAFEMGHIPGAINLPIYSGLVDRSKMLADIPYSNEIVVYCQSQNCHWGEDIAADLFYRGYRKVRIYPGGWVAWKQHERAASDQQ
jgi:rhodanese-related sulfurtransferase